MNARLRLRAAGLLALVAASTLVLLTPELAGAIGAIPALGHP